MKRNHIKSFQVEHYKKADERIKKAANQARLYFLFPLNGEYIRLTGTFKRLQLI